MTRLRSCLDCKAQFDPIEARSASGTPLARGSFCPSCGAARALALAQDAARIEANVRRNLWSAYRGWWKHYTPPLRWTRLLRSERDNCPYCGIALPDTTADRKQLRTVVDHMDPLELGGEDSLRNVVCCCSRCNSRKKDRLFLDWLQKLDEPFRTRACEIYQFKHQHLPDAFRIENFSMRIEGTPLFLELNAAEFRRELRRLLPLQDGPPTLYLFDMMKPHPGPVDIESMICSDRSPP